MAYDNVHYKGGYYQAPKKMSFKKLAIVLLFLGVLAVIFLTTFYDGGFSLIGKSIANLDPESSMYFSADLGVPEFTLNDNFPKIKIVSSSESTLFAGDQQYTLSEGTEIVFEDFSGKLYFNEHVISVISGSVSRMVVNGLPVSSKNNRKIKVGLNSEVSYNSIEFGEGTALTKINFITSGKIDFDEANSITLKDETFSMNNFLGEVSIFEKRMNLKGYTDGIDLIGEKRRISLSN